MRLRYWVSLCLLSLLLLSGCTSVGNREAAEAYYNLGRAYFDLGRLDESKRAYQRAVELDPDLLVANYNLARLYIEEGRFGEAEAILEELLLDDPDNTILHETRGWLAYRRGDLEAASSAYRRSLELGIGNAAVWYNIGLIEREREREAEATEAFEEAVYYDPDTLLYRLALGAQYARWEELQQAIDQLSPLYSAGRREPELVDDLSRYLLDFEEYAALFEVVQEVLEEKVSKPSDEEERRYQGRLYYCGAFALLIGFERAEEGIEYLEKALSLGFDEEEELAKLLDYPDIPRAEEIRLILENEGLVRSDSAPPAEADEASPETLE